MFDHFCSEPYHESVAVAPTAELSGGLSPFRLLLMLESLTQPLLPPADFSVNQLHRLIENFGWSCTSAYTAVYCSLPKVTLARLSPSAPPWHGSRSIQLLVGDHFYRASPTPATPVSDLILLYSKLPSTPSVDNCPKHTSPIGW